MAQRGPSTVPTPWATGLPIAAFAAVLVGLGDVAFVRAISVAAGWLWVPANLAVCAGLVPGLWLLRRVPFWRWLAVGAAAGIVAAWVVLVLRGAT
ncbi:MAG: DUF2537 domain-containing protein [Pseudonocardia sp.]